MDIECIIELQLEAEFGVRMPLMVQRMVDSELNRGVWKDGYDLAVNPPFSRQEEGQELLDIVLSHYPEFVIDRAQLREQLERELTQSSFANVCWLIDSRDGSFCMTDSLRVARWKRNEMLWRSARISYDGISLESIQNDRLNVFSFSFDSYDTDLPFVLDWDTGVLKEGEIIEL